VRAIFSAAYSARKLGLVSTGNAGGNHNLNRRARYRRSSRTAAPNGTRPARDRVARPGSQFGHGRLLTRAAGYWIEGGEIAYPVEEITIAGNLARMYRDIVAIGNDVDRRGSRHCGSVLIGAMTIAGN